MNSNRTPLVLGLAGVFVAIIWLLIVGGGCSTPTDTGGAMFGPAERDTLNAAPVSPGPAPTGPNRPVEFTDPRSVATAYVVAGYGLRGADSGRTNRRATPYAAPGGPPSEVGVLPLTPPGPGRHTAVTVGEVVQVAGEPTDTRRGYRVGYRSVVVLDGAPDPTPNDTRVTSAAPRSRYLALARQLDGRWLVAADTADAQVGEP